MKYQHMSDQQLDAHIKFLQRQITESNGAAIQCQLKDALAEKNNRIDEISKGLAQRYHDKSLAQYTKHYKQHQASSAAAKEAGERAGETHRPDVRSFNQARQRGAEREAGIHHGLASKRLAGIQRAKARLRKEDLDEMSDDEINDLIENFEQLDELSKDTLKSYMTKAKASQDHHQYKSDVAANAAYTMRNFKTGGEHQLRQAMHHRNKVASRILGQDRAQAKMKEEVENLDEISTDKLKKYVAGAEGDLKKRHQEKRFDMKGFDRAGHLGRAKFMIKHRENNPFKEDIEQVDEISQATATSYLKKSMDDPKRAPGGSKEQQHRRGWSNAMSKFAPRSMKEAATDDKNPTAHGAEKMSKMDGRGTDAAVKNRTGTSTFDKNPQLLGRNADVESGKQWMVSFVNGIPDCLVPGETENEVVARMRMIMSNPQLINQVSNVQTTSAPTQQKMPRIRALGESHLIEDYEFDVLENVPFFETADVYMAAVNAGADAELIEDLNIGFTTLFSELYEDTHVTHVSWRDIEIVCEAVGLDEEDTLAIGSHLNP